MLQGHFLVTARSSSLPSAVADQRQDNPAAEEASGHGRPMPSVRLQAQIGECVLYLTADGLGNSYGTRHNTGMHRWLNGWMAKMNALMLGAKCRERRTDIVLDTMHRAPDSKGD